MVEGKLNRKNRLMTQQTGDFFRNSFCNLYYENRENNRQ